MLKGLFYHLCKLPKTSRQSSDFFVSALYLLFRSGVLKWSYEGVSQPNPGTAALGIIEKARLHLKRNTKYQSDFPHRLYLFFTSYKESFGAPSFSKFARSIGVTLEDVESFREHKKFDKAYRECTEIRRDYLIDNALSKKFDSSFTKFLLSEIEDDEKCGENSEIKLSLKVIEENEA